jgi:WD40 repeat protein
VWNFSTGEIQNTPLDSQNPCFGDIRAFSPDGSLLVSKSDMEVAVCSTGSLKPVILLHDLDGTDESFTFTENNSGLLVAGESKFKLINIKSGKVLFEITGSTDDYSVVEDKLLIHEIFRSAILIYDLRTGRLKQRIPVSNNEGKPSIHGNGRLLAIAAIDNIDLIDIKTGELLFSVDDYYSHELDFSRRDNNLFMINGSELFIWDISAFSDSSQYPQIASVHHSDPLFPGSESDAIPTTTPSAPALNVQMTPTPVPAKGPAGGIFNNQPSSTREKPFKSTWSWDGSLIAVATNLQTDILSRESSKILFSLPNVNRIIAMQFSQDNSMLALQISNDHVEVWDLSARQIKFKLSDPGCFASRLWFTGNDNVLNADCGGTGYQWKLDGESSKLTSRQDIAAPLPGSAGYRIRLEEISATLLNRDGEILKYFEYPFHAIGTHQFSDDGKLLFLGYFKYQVAPKSGLLFYPNTPSIGHVWDVSTPEKPVLITTITEEKWNLPYYLMANSYAVQFTKDDRYLLSCMDDHQIHIWQISTGKLLSTVPGTIDFTLSEDETRLETLEEDGVITIWDISNKRKPVMVWQLTTYKQ